MLTIIRSTRLAFFLIAASTGAVSGQAIQPKTITNDDAKFVLRQVEELDKSRHHLWEKLQLLAGNQTAYRVEDVMKVLGTLPKIPATYEHPSQPVPSRYNAVSEADADRYLRLMVILSPPKKTEADLIAEYTAKYKNLSKEEMIRTLAKENATASDPVDDLHKKFDVKPAYYPSEILDVQANGPKPAMEDAPVSIPPPKGFWDPIKYGLLHPMIRKNWSDVLLAEDLSQPGTAKSKTGDLVGATFSYNNDTRSNTESWSAIGSLIFPVDYRFPVLGGWTPAELLIAPSVSINRISTNGDPKTEADQLLSRLGIFADWEEPCGAVQVRGAFVYGTDTGFRTSMPAFETDIEPQLTWQSSKPATGAPSIATRFFKLGYKNILWPLTPGTDQTDNSLLDYQFRVYLHMEGGDLQRAAALFNTVDGSFLRAGPAMQLRINAPHLVFGRSLSFTGGYSYFPAISGNPDHNKLLTLDLTLGLVSLNPPGDTSLQRKISLNFDYTDGGLDFTKQDVRLWAIGLSILY